MSDIETKLNTLKTDNYAMDHLRIDPAKIYSKVDILYFLIDAESCIIASNSYAQETLGFEPEDLIGKKFPELSGLEDRHLLETAVANCFQKGYLKSHQGVLVHKNGRCIPVRINGMSIPVTNGDVPTVQLYLRDITEEVESANLRQLALRLLHRMMECESTDRLLKELLGEVQKAFDCDGIGLSLSWPDGEKQCLGNWRHVDIAPEAAQSDFRRWSPERWTGLVESVQPQAADSNCTGLYIRSIREARSQDPHEPLSLFGDYDSLAVLPMAYGPARGHCILADRATDRWRVGEIRFLEELLQTIKPVPDRKPPSAETRGGAPPVPALENPYAGVCLTRNGLVESVNSWFANLLGAGQADLSGRTLLERVEPEHHATLLEIQSLAVSNPGELQSAKVVLKTFEDQSRTVHCSVVTPDALKPNEQVWYWTDLREAQDARAQLIHSKRMETLGMLAGSIVLDFNNQLASILGYGSMLSESIPRTSPLYDDLQQIVTTAERASELTSRLLACAQGSPHPVADLDINPLINEVAGILSKAFAKDLLIRAELDAELDRIQADASQIQQMVLEVALNAKEAMPNGGKIVFQTRNLTLSENDARVRKAAAGRYVQITISDNGFGMTHEIKRRLVEGSPDLSRGVGLDMVRDVVEKHHGFLSVFSEKGQGTVFKLCLPVQPKTAKAAHSRYTGSISTGNETILLVDNESVFRDTGQKMLQRYGYQVIPAQTGQEAVDLYKRHQDKIDLVILDAAIPGLEINKLLGWLYRLNPRAKVLASVAIGERETLERELRHEVTGFVQKPFHVRSLIQNIQATLNA
jgi:PAS domain S-box-containing protein